MRPGGEDRAVCEAIETLARAGWSVGAGIVEPALSSALAEEALGLWQAGAFRPAAVGRGVEMRVDAAIRGDSLLWLDPARPTSPQQAFWSLMERFRERLNRELFLSLHELELQYAAYPPGAAYERHVDQFQEVQARLVTVLLYLNRGWTPDDGGELAIHPAPGEACPISLVRPELGTFVCFRSDRIPHEVRPARRLRLSLGGWFRVRPEIPLPGARPRLA